MSSSSVWSRLSAVIGLVLVCIAGVARADEPLLWKFAAGDVHHYLMVQDMTMSVAMGSATQTTTIKQNIDMSWKVDSIKDDGSAVLTQKIERMRMNMDMPGGQKMEFDSAAKQEDPTAAGKPASPLTQMMGPMLKALTSSAFKVTMSTRGEITDVDVPEELLKGLQASPGAKLIGDLQSEKGFKDLVQRGSLVLPTELKEGTEWTSKVEMDNAAVGKQTVETTYKYAGSREQDGATMEVFKPTMTMGFGGEGKAGKVEIAKQDSSGEILFNRNAGRLEQSTLKQDMEMNVNEGAQQAKLTINQTVELKWMPEEKR